MARAILAGAVYWGIVFAWAFALGVLRTVLVAPRIGQLSAVLLETPLVLGASWVASRWTVRRLGVGFAATERLVMGGAAFSLLMIAELATSVFAFGRPPAQWLAGFRTVPGAVGLIAQIAFGFVPLLQRATHRP
jgi:hypothetical protein